MIEIRPVSDLRNKFPEIEALVQNGDPVYLTKNGYGSMVVLSIEAYSKMIEETELLLSEADKEAAETTERLSHEEVFDRVRRELDG